MVRARTCRLRPAVPVGTGATGRTGVDHRGAQGVLGSRHQAVRHSPGKHLLPTPIQDSDPRRRRGRATHPGDRRPPRRWLQPAVCASRPRPQARGAARPCRKGRSPVRRAAGDGPRPADHRGDAGRGRPAGRGAPRPDHRQVVRGSTSRRHRRSAPGAVPGARGCTRCSSASPTWPDRSRSSGSPRSCGPSAERPVGRLDARSIRTE